jgi:hypothetical protein
MKHSKKQQFVLESLPPEQIVYCWKNKISVKKLQKIIRDSKLTKEMLASESRLVELLASIKTDPDILSKSYDLKTKTTLIQYGVSCKQIAELESSGLTATAVAWSLRHDISLVEVKKWLDAQLEEPVIYRLLPLRVSLEDAVFWLKLETDLDAIATLCSSRMTPQEYEKWRELPLTVPAIASFSLIRTPIERVRAGISRGETCTEIWEKEISKIPQET